MAASSASSAARLSGARSPAVHSWVAKRQGVVGGRVWQGSRVWRVAVGRVWRVAQGVAGWQGVEDRRGGG